MIARGGDDDSLVTNCPRYPALGGTPGLGSIAASSCRPSQWFRYTWSRCMMTTGVPFNGAALLSHRCMASCQRASNSLPRCAYCAAPAGSIIDSRAVSAFAIPAMLWGSSCTCGLPWGWISPSDQSRLDGTSRSFTCAAASKYPGLPGWMRLLPDSCMSTGNQPTSSSAPLAMSSSAERARAMRLGFASTRCTSCNALVAVRHSPDRHRARSRALPNQWSWREP